MQVFISWSGDPSKAVAGALKSWLRYVFPRLEVWMSEQDIRAGTKWGVELGWALTECKLGIICLTPESLNSNWLAFEAGALFAAIDGSRVIPFRYQLSTSDIRPPLSQFQDVGADVAGTYKLVQSINEAFKKQWYAEEEELRTAFQTWWPKLEQNLNTIQDIKPMRMRTDRDILEELLDLARKEGIRDLNAVLVQLFSIPNVRRVEVAAKEVAGRITDRIALRITVSKKLPIAEIPQEQLIPESIFGMPTDVVEGA